MEDDNEQISDFAQLSLAPRGDVSTKGTICHRRCVRGDIPVLLAPCGQPSLAAFSEDGVVIDFGQGWIAEGERVFHSCGPDVRAMLGDATSCECGAEIPRIVEEFRAWLAEPSAPANASR
jgi:hypothetical protein